MNAYGKLLDWPRTNEDTMKFVSETENGGYKMDTNISVRLLTAAGVLMLLSGCIFGFTQQWIYAASVWVGAFGCLIAALNFKDRKDNQDRDD